MIRTIAVLVLLNPAWAPSALAQTIDTFAGNGSSPLSGGGGPPTTRTMSSPQGLWLTATGLLVALFITNEQKGEIASAAAESSCGHKQ